MARFFFDLHNDHIAIDEEGRELPDVEAARRSAEADARDMAAESVRGGTLDMRHYVEVADGSRETLFRVTFGEVIRISGL